MPLTKKQYEQAFGRTVSDDEYKKLTSLEKRDASPPTRERPASSAPFGGESKVSKQDVAKAAALGAAAVDSAATMSKNVGSGAASSLPKGDPNRNMKANVLQGGAESPSYRAPGSVATALHAPVGPSALIAAQQAGVAVPAVAAPQPKLVMMPYGGPDGSGALPASGAKHASEKGAYEGTQLSTVPKRLAMGPAWDAVDGVLYPQQPGGQPNSKLAALVPDAPSVSGVPLYLPPQNQTLTTPISNAQNSAYDAVDGVFSGSEKKNKVAK